MFKYRFVCSNKETAILNINQKMLNDLPCGKSIFGGNLYSRGIHFKECGEKIRGFYLDKSENKHGRGSQIRVCFTGRFVEENGNLFFDCYIYPRIIEVLFLVLVFMVFASGGKIFGFIMSIAVLLIFGKGYYNMIKETHNSLKVIFK